jgi:hypothetical protein
MDDAPEIDDLARRYLDLWQDHWAALAADPRLAEAMARLMAMGAPALMTAASAFMTGAAAGGAGEPAAPRAPAAAAAPAGGPDGVDGLARRLALVEERLARLESASTPRRRSPRRPGGG